MDLTIDLLAGLVGLLLIVGAAERLVAAAVGTALALRMTPFVVAAVFIGFDPENLAVGASAATRGSDGIAIGTILGATMVAIALALGLTAILTPVDVEPAPWSLLALPSAAVAGFAAAVADGELGRADGALLVAAYAAAVVALVRLGRRGVTIEPHGEAAEAIEDPPTNVRALLLLAGSLAVLVAGSELLVGAARDLVDVAGWSETTAGLSVVALAVSIEELARELPAARRGHAELTVGNVTGSILAFVLLNAGLIALVHPIEISEDVRTVQLPIVAATVLVVLGLLRRGGLRRRAGLVLVALYAGFLLSLSAA